MIRDTKYVLSCVCVVNETENVCYGSVSLGLFYIYFLW